MSTAITPFDPKILEIIRTSFDGKGLPMPFVKEIFLLECHAAGTTYIDAEAVEPTLTIGDIVVMKREPENEYDSLAVILFTAAMAKIGYIPRDKNEVIARLMDAGKLIFGKLESKRWKGEWLKIDVRIFMRDMG